MSFAVLDTATDVLFDRRYGIVNTDVFTFRDVASINRRNGAVSVNRFRVHDIGDALFFLTARSEISSKSAGVKFPVFVRFQSVLKPGAIEVQALDMEQARRMILKQYATVANLPDGRILDLHYVKEFADGSTVSVKPEEKIDTLKLPEIRGYEGKVELYIGVREADDATALVLFVKTEVSVFALRIDGDTLAKVLDKLHDELDAGFSIDEAGFPSMI